MSLLNLDPEPEKEPDHIQYLALIRHHWLTLNAIKEQLGVEAYESARDIWLHDIPDNDRILLWRAPTRGFGSVWDTWEREALKKGWEYEP